MDCTESRHRNILPQHFCQRIQYPVFRESFFFDPTVNPVLKGEGGDPDPISTARAARKLWSSSGRSISSRLPKTAVPPGSAFRNECYSPDQLYSSSRGSLGYEVTRSLRATSLCSTTKRFDEMDSAGEWKLTSEKPSPTHYSFRRAAEPTWIEQVEERQRRFSPHARAPQPTLKSAAEQRLPNFLQGVRNPVHTKCSALKELIGAVHSSAT
ncbi:hypothetical protein PybrP1_001828 [[Pythium] brassicae (nom. inval.)]|nr:hypothetical protein PybrP1_001828 [[Pythium] brassicae (nom. inval.)]